MNPGRFFLKDEFNMKGLWQKTATPSENKIGMVGKNGTSKFDSKPSCKIGYMYNIIGLSYKQ